MSNDRDMKQENRMTVKIIKAPEQAQEMAARYIRALYGVSLLDFACQLEKAQ